MKAIVLKEQGGVDQLEYTDLPIPKPSGPEVLIKVQAISINPADTYMRKDPNLHYVFNGESPKVLGWDISGTIEQLGSKVQRFQIGDEVFGLINFPTYEHAGHAKGYAEYVVADERYLALKPSNVTHDEAAAATLAALTAWQPMKKAGIKKGDRVFVTAAGGGVGHFAIQMAKYFGAHVIALASDEKKDLVLELGADEFIDYRKTNFWETIEPVDFVFEGLQGDHIKKSLEMVKRGGQLLSLTSHIKGSELEEFAKIRGVHAYYNAVVSSGTDMEEIADLLKKGHIRPFISKRFALGQMADAHLEIEKGRTAGKIIVKP